MAQQDYYAVLGVPASATPGRDQEAVPQARGEASSGQESERSEGRRHASRRSRRRTRRWATPRSGSSTTRCASSARSAASAAARAVGAGARAARAVRRRRPRGQRPLRGLRHRRTRRPRRHLQLDVRRRRAARPAARARVRAARSAAQDVETTLEIPFRTAALGGKVPVELDVNEECATCHGSGAAPGAKLRDLPASATAAARSASGRAASPCSVRVRCASAAARCRRSAAHVRRRGEVRTRKKVMITVPAGVDTGTKIRLKGQGGARLEGRPAGRPADHLPGEAGPLLQARGARPHRAGADQHRAGDARHARSA